MSDAASGPPSAPKSRKRKFKSAIDAVTFTQRCAQAAANSKHINLADISSLLEDNSAGAEYQQLMLSLAAKEDENRQLTHEKQQLARDYAKLQAAYALLQDELDAKDPARAHKRARKAEVGEAQRLAIVDDEPPPRGWALVQKGRPDFPMEMVDGVDVVCKTNQVRLTVALYRDGKPARGTDLSAAGLRMRVSLHQAESEEPVGEWLNEAHYSAEAVLREELEHTFTLKIERLSSDKALGGNKLRMKHFILKVSPVAAALPAGIEVVPACTREFVSKARPDKTRAHPKKEGAAAAAAAAPSSTAASEAGPDTELSFDEISDALLEPLSAQRVTSEYAKELLETVADESLVDAEAFAASFLGEVPQAFAPPPPGAASIAFRSLGDDDDDDDDDDDEEEEEGGGAAAKQLESLRAGVEQMRVKLRAATALAVLATAKIGVGLSPGAMPVA